jgi:hypothetical protein
LVNRVCLQIPPQKALLGLVSAPLSLATAGWLWRHQHQPQRLKPALALSVLSVLLHGLGIVGWLPATGTGSLTTGALGASKRFFGLASAPCL